MCRAVLSARRSAARGDRCAAQRALGGERSVERGTLHQLRAAIKKKKKKKGKQTKKKFDHM